VQRPAQTVKSRSEIHFAHALIGRPKRIVGEQAGHITRRVHENCFGHRGTGRVQAVIDEILRGTNSEDKTHGSEQFIRKLLKYNCLALFATHDLNLSKLETEMPELISNYCFESIIENGELHFDYQLQRGIARNRNASFLMKKMEII